MDIHALLEEVLGIKGITSVALVSEDGFVIESATAPGNTIDLEAHPRPATITFTGAPPKTTVRCTAPPCRDTTTPFMVGAGTFPPIPMSQHEVEVSLELKAIGYQGKVDKFRIQPGNNQYTVNLTLNPR